MTNRGRAKFVVDYYDRQGNVLEETFIGGNIRNLKNYGIEIGAFLMKVIDPAEDKKTYFIRSGNVGRWGTADPSLIEHLGFFTS